LALVAFALSLVLAVPSVLLPVVDSRELNGVSIWLKPIKFQLSIGLHFLTLALLLRFVTPDVRESRLVRWSMVAAIVAAAAEILYITVQAGRGRASHYNSETAWEAFAFGVMGVGAVIIVLGSLIIGALVLFDLRKRRRATGAAFGAGIGLTLGSAGTLVVGIALGSAGGHWIGGDATDATGLPLLGWSTTGGDLRVPHFFATHVMQVLPVLGWIVGRIWRGRPWLVVCPAGAAYAAMIAATFLQARAGIPFLG
jgi:hypothetical protein